MINIKLNDGQSGYDVIDKYIKCYWKHNVVGAVVFRIGTSYDGEDYYLSNQVAEPMGFHDIGYEMDWWEGEKYIKLFGIKSVGELDISGGIYTEDE